MADAAAEEAPRAKVGGKRPRGFASAVRRAIGVLSAIYLLLLIVVLWATHQIGERHWLTGTLLFLPPVLWLSPLAGLTPLALGWARVALLWHLLAVLAVAIFSVDYGRARPEPASGALRTIVSNNTGERDFAGLVALVKEVQPDLVALQESSPAEAWTLSRLLGNRHVAYVGEFMIVSRFPIRQSRPIPGLESTGRSIAARFELDCEGRPLVLYVVHLPTPRMEFELLRGAGVMVEWRRGGGIFSPAVRREYAKAMRRRVELAENFAEQLAAEQGPVLVVGDFNAPAQGYVRRLFSGRFTDFFSASGRGLGLTFPGISSTPLSWSGPWLRLDYAFGSAGIRPVETRVESRSRAQHLAVVARFWLE